MGVTEIVGILRLVDGVLQIMSAIPEAKADADELRAQIRIFIVEGRNPTAEEWDTLNARIATSMQILEDRLAG